MAEFADRALSISFSMKLSQFDKLNQLTEKSGKDRSNLLSEWIDEKFNDEFPQPISLREEMDRL